MKSMIILVFLFLVGCSSTENYAGNIHMPLGVKTIIKGNISCTYAGPVNDHRFSVSSNGYRSAINIYYSNKSKYIVCSNRKFKVIDITNEELTVYVN